MSSGFHNIQSRSREERRSIKDKESWEKSRLANRKEGYVRIDTSVTGHAMTEYDKKSQGYMSDANRFHSDTAGEAKGMRNKSIQRREQITNVKRNRTMDREEQRWKSMEHGRQVEEQKWDRHRQEGLKALRNKSSVPFDPITLTYNKTSAGEQLRHSDNMVKHRANLRSQNLAAHNNRSGINPITGESR